MNDLQLFYNPNQFVTKTCLTTFTYSTTYVDNDGATKIESREKVITNTATEERNAYRIQPTATSGITLTQVQSIAFPSTDQFSFFVNFFNENIENILSFRLHKLELVFLKRLTHI